MSLLPRSRTARRRLMTVAVAAPILVLAAVVAIYAMKGSISFFYTPSQAMAAHVPAGRPIQLGGLVRSGSVVRKPDGEVDFTVADKQGASPVVFKGELPDLFREGQGVVAIGAFDDGGVFAAARSSPSTTSATCRPSSPPALKK